jgi:UDP-N-acetylglucosamine transferase subunit ALG13
VSTFVSVGTCHQSVARLLKEVAVLAGRGILPKPVYVQHGHTPFGSESCVPTAFMIREEFETRLAGAELVIIHGGATVLQAIRAGKVPVVMPRRIAYGEHFDDHQVEFARSLEAKDQIVAAYEAADLESCVNRALQMQKEASGRPRTHQTPVLLTLVGETLSVFNERLSRRDQTARRGVMSQSIKPITRPSEDTQ